MALFKAIKITANEELLICAVKWKLCMDVGHFNWPFYLKLCHCPDLENSLILHRQYDSGIVAKCLLVHITLTLFPSFSHCVCTDCVIHTQANAIIHSLHSRHGFLPPPSFAFSVVHFIFLEFHGKRVGGGGWVGGVGLWVKKKRVSQRGSERSDESQNLKLENLSFSSELLFF